MPHTGFFIAIFFFFINLDEINAQASFAAPEKLVFLVLTAFPTKQKINTQPRGGWAIRDNKDTQAYCSIVNERNRFIKTIDKLI